MTRLHIYKSQYDCDYCGMRKLDLYWDEWEFLFRCGRCKNGWRIRDSSKGKVLEPDIFIPITMFDPIEIDEMQRDILSGLFKNNEEAWQRCCELIGGLPCYAP